MEQKCKGLLGYFLTELFEPSENRLLSRSAPNEGFLFRGSLGNTAIDIQHIGSTAIPSIHAKPIIDIVVGMHDPTDIMPYAEVLKRSHYIFRGEDVSGQLLFVKGDFESDIRTHHIHVVKWNGPDWNNYLNFRDYLNAFPEKAKQYDRCKLNLAAQFPQERGQYTKGKQDLVSALLKEAALWKSNQ